MKLEEFMAVMEKWYSQAYEQVQKCSDNPNNFSPELREGAIAHYHTMQIVLEKARQIEVD